MKQNSFFDAARDVTAHCVACPLLWGIVGATSIDADWDPAERCGLLPINKKNFYDVARAFVIYHTIKHTVPVAIWIARVSAARRLAIIAVSP